MPFVIRWVDEAGVTRDTVAAFGVLMLLCAALSMPASRRLLARERAGCSAVTKATRRGRKGHISLVSYVVAIAIALLSPARSIAIYVLVAVIWLIPDRRFEQLD